MADGRKPLGVGRRIAVAIGVLIMLFSGGCALAFINVGHMQLGDVGFILGISAIGFLPGLAIVLSALYAGRPR